jgi:hypothetical protein
MDLQAAENAHKTEQKSQVKQSWNCPCAGCKKAVKQERERILAALEDIDLDAPYQLNAVGLKQLIVGIINPGDKK